MRVAVNFNSANKAIGFEMLEWLYYFVGAKSLCNKLPNCLNVKSNKFNLVPVSVFQISIFLPGKSGGEELGQFCESGWNQFLLTTQNFFFSFLSCCELVKHELGVIDCKILKGGLLLLKI